MTCAYEQDEKGAGAGSTVAFAISGPSTEKEAAFPLQCVKNQANARAQTANGFREVLVTLHQIFEHNYKY